MLAKYITFKLIETKLKSMGFDPHVIPAVHVSTKYGGRLPISWVLLCVLHYDFPLQLANFRSELSPHLQMPEDHEGVVARAARRVLLDWGFIKETKHRKVVLSDKGEGFLLQLKLEEDG